MTTHISMAMVGAAVGLVHLLLLRERLRLALAPRPGGGALLHTAGIVVPGTGAALAIWLFPHGVPGLVVGLLVARSFVWPLAPRTEEESCTR